MKDVFRKFINKKLTEEKIKDLCYTYYYMGYNDCINDHDFHPFNRIYFSFTANFNNLNEDQTRLLEEIISYEIKLPVDIIRTTKKIYPQIYIKLLNGGENDN